MGLNAIESGNTVPISPSGTINSCRPSDWIQPKSGPFLRLL
ncbi:hypothetical protein SAMN05216505_104147 [Streptomyces prasinopilosus]|uniref:Uncharacterized protein n=1 Tax=Streptomyces prasinopilosus TaxID=67344 RepID=A0A1G6QK75_9ACTN|nr:hypothetical protein SAMN05216505_104147 [Streptomyces prasinopilosus]